MHIQQEAENFWSQYSYLLNSTGNSTADSEQMKAFEAKFNNLSPEARSVVSTWRDGGRDWVHTQNSYMANVDFRNENMSAGIVHNFASNGNKLNEISIELNSAADEIRQYITDIYAKIKELSGYWSGQAYQEFSSNCEKYREALEGLVVLLEAFSKKFDMLDSDTLDLVNEIKKYINNGASALGTGSYSGYYSSN